MTEERKEKDKDNIDKLYRVDGIHTDDLYTFKRMDTLVGTKDANDKVNNESKFIHGGISSKNEVKNSVNKSMFAELIEQTKNKVEDANTAIRNSEFTIRPTYVDGGSSPCEFCECYDICFMKKSDSRIIKKPKKEKKTKAKEEE